MMKKAVTIWTRYPGLRLLRSLSLGYHLAPFQGFKMMAKIFSTSTEAAALPKEKASE